ncbi:Extracellular matrix protein 2 [Acipenser ruthenus]|uniref:Extracellular matrix protein 2 n=1 Tax=Acipenser ruthenus TaxID=7906 RepID=A0A662YJR8_ACIRT|nr:Extracellular matrix protein 2 [Acipenser ruthenus]
MQGGEDRTKSSPPKRNMRRKPEQNTKTQPTAAPKLGTSKRNQSARPRFRKQEESALKRKEVGIGRQETGFSSREVLPTVAGKQEVMMPKKQEVTEPKKQEVTTPKKQDMMTPKKQEVTTPKKQEVTTPKKQEVTTSKKHKVTTPKKQEVTTPKKQEVRSGEQEVKTGKQKVGVVKKQEVQKSGKKIEKPAEEKRGGGGGSRVRLIDLQDSDEEDLEEEFEDIGGLGDDLDDFFFGRPLPDSLLPPRGRFMESLPPGCILSESTIACGNARMRHLPILHDLGVTTLYLAENEISEIPERAFLGLPNLEWLDLSKNRLDNSTMHLGAFRNLIKLKRLNLDGNQITQIPLLPPSLEELKMNDNKLQGLDQHSFKGLSNLLTLELEGNALHDGNVNPLAFKPLRKLIYLRLDQNLLRAIPSGLPPSLQELHLAGNVIEEVSEGVLNKTLNLSVLVLSNNRLQETRIAPLAWIHLPITCLSVCLSGGERREGGWERNNRDGRQEKNRAGREKDRERAGWERERRGKWDNATWRLRDSIKVLLVFLPPSESESPAPDEWERAQLGLWRQEKPRCSAREWDEVIQVAVESLPERPQPMAESPAPPEGEYHVPPSRERPMLPAPEPQRTQHRQSAHRYRLRKKTLRRSCHQRAPLHNCHLRESVLRRPRESAPQPVRACRVAASERLHSNTSKRVPPATWKRLSYATREREYLLPLEPQRECPAPPEPQRGSPASSEPQRESPMLPEHQRESPALPEAQREPRTTRAPDREPSIVALERVPHAVAAAPSPCQTAARFQGCCWGCTS